MSAREWKRQIYDAARLAVVDRIVENCSTSAAKRTGLTRAGENARRDVEKMIQNPGIFKSVIAEEIERALRVYGEILAESPMLGRQEDES